MITMGCQPRMDPAHRGEWFKSSVSSGDGSCVKVRFHDDLVSIRDSKYRRDPAHDPHREPVITVTAGQWTVFLDEFTGHATRGANGALIVEDGPDGTLLRAADQDTTLSFTHAEWQAYLAGVHAHEFEHPGRTHLTSA